MCYIAQSYITPPAIYQSPSCCIVGGHRKITLVTGAAWAILVVYQPPSCYIVGDHSYIPSVGAIMIRHDPRFQMAWAAAARATVQLRNPGLRLALPLGPGRGRRRPSGRLSWPGQPYSERRSEAVRLNLCQSDLATISKPR